MQTRANTNLILFIVLLLIISFIVLKPELDTHTSTLTNINKDKITQITIHRDGQNIVVKKTNNQWRMIQPHNIRAHNFRIQSLLALLETDTYKPYDIKKIDLKTYGLDQPSAHIQFDDTHIYFGKTNPVNGMRYIQANNQMHLLLDNLYPLIRSQPTSFIDLSLLPPDAKINKLSLPDLTLSKSDNNWQITPQQSASADQIQTLLQNWSYAQAFAVHAYIKRKSLGHIKINFEQATPIEFEITDDNPWIILARTDLGIEYHIDGSQKDKLLQLPNP